MTKSKQSLSQNGLTRTTTNWRYSRAVLKAQRKFGVRLKIAREQRRMTREKLAERCGIKSLKINRIENGEVNVCLSRVIRLAKVLRININRLLKNIA